MRSLAIAGCLLAGLLMLTPATADPLWSGPFAGTVAQGGTATHEYDTHPPGTLCLAVYIPHTFVVTLSAAPTDTMTLSVGSLSATTTAGEARLTFIANYCTSFDIHVTGGAVTVGAYAVTVEHVNALNTGGLGSIVCCVTT